MSTLAISRTRSEAAPADPPIMRKPAAAGRDALSPWSVPVQGWKEVALRAWRESSSDNIGLVAAGVAFYSFLALVPLLGAIVLTYGLVAKPSTVISNVQTLASVLPADAAKLVGQQLMNVVHESEGKKGLGLLLALAIALFGARNGAGSIITALNIAYEEEERRGFIRVNLLALAMTAAAVAVGILAVLAITALGYLHELVPGTPAPLLFLGKILSYLLLALAAAAGAATLYRYAPSREKARWDWLTPGSMFAGVMWLLLTLGFGIYVANFGNYDATYGSLGAVVVLLTWLYLSSYVLLFGAELNSELEHQTAQDTTDGEPAPMGQRGAWVADHVAGGPRSAADARRSPETPAAPEDRGRNGSIAAARPPARDYAMSRATARIGQLAGLRKVGTLSSGMATLGLALLRRKGTAPQGAMLLAGAAALALATSRER